MCFLLFKILFNKDISLHSKFLLLPFFYKQKLDLNIVIMRKIIVTPEQVVVVEVKMKEVVVLGQRLVVEVQEVEVQVEVEVRMQVQQQLQAWTSELVECFGGE